MPLDENDLKQIKGLFTELTTELKKDFVSADDVTKIVTQGITKATKDLEGRFQSASTAAGDDQAGSEVGKGKGKGDEDPELARMRQKLAQLEARSEQERTAREKAEQQARETALDQSLRDALTAAGVPPERHRHAIPYLRSLRLDDGKPVIGVDEHGRPTFTAQRKGFQDQLSVSEGLSEWIKSEDGRAYLPPSGVQGTGDGSGQRGTRSERGGNAPKTADGRLDLEALKDRVFSNLSPSTFEG